MIFLKNLHIAFDLLNMVIVLKIAYIEEIDPLLFSLGLFFTSFHQSEEPSHPHKPDHLGDIRANTGEDYKILGRVVSSRAAKN